MILALNIISFLYLLSFQYSISAATFCSQYNKAIEHHLLYDPLLLSIIVNGNLLNNNNTNISIPINYCDIYNEQRKYGIVEVVFYTINYHNISTVESVKSVFMQVIQQLGKLIILDNICGWFHLPNNTEVKGTVCAANIEQSIQSVSTIFNIETQLEILIFLMKFIQEEFHQKENLIFIIWEDREKFVQSNSFNIDDINLPTLETSDILLDLNVNPLLLYISIPVSSSIEKSFYIVKKEFYLQDDIEV
jgi:hypothetical protein